MGVRGNTPHPLFHYHLSLSFGACCGCYMQPTLQRNLVWFRDTNNPLHTGLKAKENAEGRVGEYLWG
jgi:hypothetical protein